MLPPVTRYLVTLFFVAAAPVVQAMTWTHTQFEAQMGKVIASQDSLILTPNEQGQILLTIPTSGLALSSDQRVSFIFNGSPPPTIYLIWRRGDSDQLFQHGFATNGDSQPYVDMAAVPEWKGDGHSMQVGFLVNTGTQVRLRELRISNPGLAEKISDALGNWSTFRTWLPVDINLYTGTRNFIEGPYPAQVFAFCTLLLVGVYLLIVRRRARLTGVAIIIFTAWVALDAFWQWRLWQQLDATRARYASLGSSEKPLASEDAVIARLTDRARDVIDNPEQRVFIASQSDSNGMRAAYYMSPFNTYWHRHGKELPETKYLRKGDYILIVRPSTVLYNREAGRIRLTLGEELDVIEKYADHSGLVLEVRE